MEMKSILDQFETIVGNFSCQMWPDAAQIIQNICKKQYAMIVVEIAFRIIICNTFGFCIRPKDTPELPRAERFLAGAGTAWSRAFFAEAGDVRSRAF